MSLKYILWFLKL